jgi:O-antigen/teichoic acid export membrane protein
MQSRPSSTIRSDLISAYGVAVARIASWVIVSAIVYRKFGPGAFALVAFVRGTIGVLNYASLGLGPAMVRLLAEARNRPSAFPVGDSKVLSYASGRPDPVAVVYSNGLAWAVMTAFVGGVLLVGYCVWFMKYSRFAGMEEMVFVVLMGMGVLLRLCSDAPAAMLQTSGRMTTDNLLLIAAEIAWPLITVVMLGTFQGGWEGAVGVSFAFASIVLAVGRLAFAFRQMWNTPDAGLRALSRPILKALFTFGLLVTLAQLADYLYAPMDYVLIHWLLDPKLLAVYAPAIQIDAGLLLIVTGLAAVLLPRTALADAGGNRERVKQYYVAGTALSVATLTAAALIVWGLSTWIFRLWLGDRMEATQAILPLVLIHTVVGGSSAVGRSVLLGMGKVRAFTAAVLVAGVCNVILGYCFVRYLGLGLKGIVLGTIVVVVARCAVWMPWYVMRALKAERAPRMDVESAPVTPAV